MPVVPTPAEIQYQKEHINDTRVPSLIAAYVSCSIIAVTAVILRFVSRKLAKVKYEADDWLIVAALVFYFGFLICTAVETHYGQGRHAILVTHPSIVAKSVLSSEVLYNPAMFCIKSSILYLYHRIFFVSRTFTLILWAVAIFVFSYGFAQAVGSIFQCTPINAAWNPEVSGHCIDSALAGTILAALNVVTDFIIIFIPMPLLWRMQAQTKKKVHIVGTFLIAGFVCFASIYRCAIIHLIARTADSTWAYARVTVWSITELGVGIFCACLPPMRPLFTHRHSKVNSKNSNSKNTNSADRKDRAAMQQSDLSLPLHPTRSKPSQSADFAHLGVLNDVDEMHGNHIDSKTNY